MIVEKLKKAISEQNFSYVADAIKDLTGEVIDVSDYEDPVDAKIREIEEQLNSLRGIKKTEKTQPKKTNNAFDDIVDELEIIPEIGEELINDKVERTRKPRPSRLVKVTCSCGKTEEVSPILARDNYTCQKCLVKKARR